jgi:hypothetical protein
VLLEPLVTILSGRPASPLAALCVIAETRPAPGVTRLVPVRVDGTPTTAAPVRAAAVHQWPDTQRGLPTRGQPIDLNKTILASAHQRKTFFVKPLVGCLVRRLSLHSRNGVGPGSV